MFTIENSADIPQHKARSSVSPGRPRSELRNTMAKLDVGQTFLVPHSEVTVSAPTFRAHCFNLAKEYGFKVSVRKFDDGFRVSRVELASGHSQP